jgi:hypothetical protein
MGGRVAIYVNLLDHDGHTRSNRKLAAEGLVAVGRRPQPVVEMSERHDREVVIGGQVEEEEGQGNRVRPTRYPDKHTGSRRTQRVSLDGVTDFLVNACQLPIP